MRTRIALVAAFAASIALSTAVTGAVTTNAASVAGTKHRHGQRGSAATAGRLAARHTQITLLELTRANEWETAWRRFARSVHPAPAPAPAPPAPTPAPAPAPAPPPPVTPPPAPAPQATLVSATDARSTTTPDWACIRDHESDDNYQDNTGNGYSGAYQFMPSTWDEAVSGAGYPQYANGQAYEAPPSVQNAAALWLYGRDGWAPWSTRYVCGL